MNEFDDFNVEQQPLQVIDNVYELQPIAIDVDPLKNVNQYNVPPFNLHFVQPHEVQSYERGDGTTVKGYSRDGVNGTGYVRSNPDNLTTNNLNAEADSAKKGF